MRSTPPKSHPIMPNGARIGGVQHIADVFSAARAEDRAALIAYIMLGFPTPNQSLDLVEAAVAAGADIIELGIPFSDPLADGPVIQTAAHRAIGQGVTLTSCLEMAHSLRKRGIVIPFLFMGYYNPIMTFSEEAFCRACYDARVDGLIVPDLPPEESEQLENACYSHGLALVYLLAPTSTPVRIQLVTERSRGFVYLVSVAGTTGPRAELPDNLGDFIGRVRRATDKPLSVGFGISSPEHAAQVAALADGVVVGSALLRLAHGSHGVDKVRSFVSGLRQAVVLNSPENAQPVRQGNA